jgi:hypothetical protein
LDECATDLHGNPCSGRSHNPPLPSRGAAACARRLATSSEIKNILTSMCWGGGGAVGVSAGASGGRRRGFAHRSGHRRSSKNLAARVLVFDNLTRLPITITSHSASAKSTAARKATYAGRGSLHHL